MVFTGLRLAAILATACVAGCSLVSLKTPERPLSNRDLNARILTREFSNHFIAAVGQCADEIGASETDPEVLTRALRWKIGAATESERAASRISPTMSLLDTWALAAQMRAFLSPGEPGRELFGSHQEKALAVAGELDRQAEALARRLSAPGELEDYRRFIDAYVREHPLESLEFQRPSVIALWSEAHGGGARLVDSMGTIPEAMSDFSDRLKISSDTLALQTLWRTQLALREAGYSGSDIRAALRQLDERFAAASKAAENAPQLVHDSIEQARSALDALERVDASSARMMAALRTEREALAADVRAERQALVAAADSERRALAQDAAAIAERVVRSSGNEARRLAREVVLLAIGLAVVLLGLPFAAGYLLGRARRG